jgi:hypothetical protein
MSRFTRSGAIAMACLVTGAMFAAQVQAQAKKVDPKVVFGKVAEVTLYRGQAQVAREMELKNGAGPVELVVTNLPAHVVANSLFAEGSKGIEVRAVRYRRRAVGAAPRQEVRRLEEQIQTLADDTLLNKANQALVAKKTAYLDKLEGFVAPTARAELSKGVLNAEALEKITTFSFKQREAAAAELLKLQKEARTIQSKMSVLMRQRSSLSTGSSKTVHEAVLFLEKRVAGPQTVRLTYLVNQCGWGPAYNFRADSKTGKVNVEYNAVIQQMSGENWDGVKLTLSTASPSISSAAPGLASLRVTLAPMGPQFAQNNKNKRQVPGIANLEAQVQSIQGRRGKAYLDNRQTLTQYGNIQTSWQLNDAAQDFQLLEFNCTVDQMASMQRQAYDSQEGPTLNYQLTNAVSLASRSDQQMIRIMESDVKSDFYHVATPLLTSHVYREAELTNTTDQDLLGGQATVYLDGRFVGRTEIGTVARGQEFLVGFGADSQLRTSREMVDRTEGVQGGNKVITFNYALAVENFKGTPVAVRIQDRVPFNRGTNQVRVVLADLKDKLSTDKAYVRADRPKGILRWDLEIPAGATGEKGRRVEYSYKIEYDRNFTLANPTSRKQMQKEFELLQLDRYNGRKK